MTLPLAAAGSELGSATGLPLFSTLHRTCEPRRNCLPGNSHVCEHPSAKSRSATGTALLKDNVQ